MPSRDEEVVERQRKNEKEDETSSGLNYFWPISAAIALRSIAANFPHMFEDRVELSSSSYSFQFLKDGVAMYNDNVDPFTYSQFHFQPIAVHTFAWLFKYANSLLLPIWIIMDIFTAVILSKTARKVIESRGDEFVKDSRQIEGLVFKLYAFNPITVISTGILSLTVPQNFVIACIFWSNVKGFSVVCAVLIGSWSSFTLYPFSLISIFAFVSNNSKLRFMFLSCISVISFSSFLIANYVLNGYSWNFLASTYSYIVNFEDIQPNVGLYWYFFVQIFDHFRSFYTISFTVLYFFMPIPVTIMIRKDPVLHFTAILLLVSIFFPYPTLNQVSVVFAIMPLQKKFIKYFRYTFPIPVGIISTVLLMPVMWHMWIVSSSGNANFFFGSTICYNVVLINIVMELIFVYSRGQVDTEYGDTVKKQVKFEFTTF